jgi:hypothetical protein
VMMPLTWNGKIREINIPEWAETIKGSDLPRDIRLVHNDILKKVILCVESDRPFMITPLELKFYRKMGIPLPQIHPDIRHEKRMKIRPRRTLSLRSCDKCGQEMLFSLSKHHEGKIYCDSCYRQEIYS